MKTVRLLLLSTVWLGMVGVSAQTIQVEKCYALFGPDGQKGVLPVLNQDGSMLAFAPTSGQLAIYDFADGSVTPVTEPAEKAFEPVFSADGRKLMYKNTVYYSRLRYEGVKSFDLNKKEAKQVLAPEREVKALRNYDNGVMLVRSNKMVKATYGKASTGMPPYVWSDGVDLNVYRKGKQMKLNPVEGANGYIWASLSPDETKILFTAAGQGTFVCDLQGRIVARLGQLNAPVWYGNDFVVGMCDEDDGYEVTASEVVMRSVDGQVKQRLSLPEQIAMNPTAASRAGMVAYETLNGEIYIVELSVTK